jgi:DNA-binding MarR family transcriptional regulator
MDTSTDFETVAFGDDLESPRAKLVYLYLINVGKATVSDIADALDLRQLTLFGVLDTLAERGYVDRDGDAYVASPA